MCDTVLNTSGCQRAMNVYVYPQQKFYKQYDSYIFSDYLDLYCSFFTSSYKLRTILVQPQIMK